MPTFLRNTPLPDFVYHFVYHTGMTSLRLFIALPLPEPVIRRLETFQECLRQTTPEVSMRLSKQEQMHLTLLFLGHTPEAAVADIDAQLTHITQQSAPFTLCLTEFGAFPSLRRPSVLWCGVGGELIKLQHLQGQVESRLGFLGLEETKNFRPHLTLARLKTAGYGDAIRQAAGSCSLIPDCWTVNSVILYRSILRSDGAVYEVLQRYHLSQ